MGDRDFEVIHIPYHSNDSICLYCAEERVLFSGDTPVRILSAGGSYPPDFIASMERLANLDIEAIYSGHDEPVRSNAGRMIQATLVNIQHPLASTLYRKGTKSNMNARKGDHGIKSFNIKNISNS